MNLTSTLHALVPPACSFRFAALTSFQHSKSSPLFRSVALHSIPCHTCFSQRSNPHAGKAVFVFRPRQSIMPGHHSPFFERVYFLRSKNKLCCLTGLLRQLAATSLSCCLQLGCHPTAAYSVFLALPVVPLWHS